MQFSRSWRPGQSITVEVITGRRQHCKQLCGGMEILFCVTFSSSRKAAINCHKLLTKAFIKLSIVWHLFEMFPQISRTPDFERRFLEKRCGLSAGVYGITSYKMTQKIFFHFIGTVRALYVVSKSLLREK